MKNICLLSLHLYSQNTVTFATVVSLNCSVNNPIGCWRSNEDYRAQEHGLWNSDSSSAFRYCEMVTKHCLNPGNIVTLSDVYFYTLKDELYDRDVLKRQQIISIWRIGLVGQRVVRRELLLIVCYVPCIVLYVSMKYLYCLIYNEKVGLNTISCHTVLKWRA